jgi:hypothetical protein
MAVQSLRPIVHGCRTGTLPTMKGLSSLNFNRPPEACAALTRSRQMTGSVRWASSAQVNIERDKYGPHFPSHTGLNPGRQPLSMVPAVAATKSCRISLWCNPQGQKPLRCGRTLGALAPGKVEINIESEAVAMLVQLAPHLKVCLHTRSSWFEKPIFLCGVGAQFSL